MCPVCVTSDRVCTTLPKIHSCIRRATTQKSPLWQHFEVSVLTAKKNAGHATPTFMEPSFNTSDHVSPQIDAASRIPFMLRRSLASLPFLLAPRKKMVVDPPAGIAVQSALLTPPTLPSQLVHLRDVHRRDVDSSICNPSDGGMGDNTSFGPNCSSLFLVLLFSRQTNLERHTSPFILSTHFSLRRLQLLS